MHATLLTTTLLAIFGSAFGQYCFEAGRQGFTTVAPNTGLTVGQTITITSNFTCSYQKGIIPSEVNYLLENTINNNGYESTLFVARRTNPGVVETFQATIPDWEYFPNASYSIVAQITYPEKISPSRNAASILLTETPAFISIVPNVS